MATTCLKKEREREVYRLAGGTSSFSIWNYFLTLLINDSETQSSLIHMSSTLHDPTPGQPFNKYAVRYRMSVIFLFVDWKKKSKRKSKSCQAGNIQGLCNSSDMPWIWKHNFFLIRGKNTLWTMYDVGSIPLLYRVLSKPWHKSWYQQMTGSGCSE